MHVAVAREAHAGQHRAAGRDLLPIEADALGESQPQLQSTLAGRVAVVIANPTDPHAPEGGILRLRQDQGVLDRHPRLVVVAVEHPLLQLQTRQLAVVHQVVIAVMIVVAALALATHPVDELLARQRRARRTVAHSPPPTPAPPTPPPAAAAAARPPERSRSSGGGVVTWMEVRPPPRAPAG